MGGVYKGWGRRVVEGSRKEAGVRVDFIPEKCSGIRKTRVDRANASQMYDREVVGSFRETGLGFFSFFLSLSLSLSLSPKPSIIFRNFDEKFAPV